MKSMSVKFAGSLLLAVGMATSACNKTPTAYAPGLADAGWTLRFTALASPATGSATAPQLTVHGDRTILSWLEKANAATTLKFVERTPSGWSEARVVASGTDFVTNAADVPSVRAIGDGALAAHWNRE